MNPATGKLSVWKGGRHACVRISGRANFALSVPFRKLIQVLRDSGQQRVLLDVSQCPFMDSTFLGVLAYEASKLAVKTTQGVEPGIELLNATASVREIIEDLGVAHLLRFSEKDLSRTDFKEVPEAGDASVTDLNRTCLEAHELLMALHPANVEKFRDVARFFAEELKNSPGQADGQK